MARDFKLLPGLNFPGWAYTPGEIRSHAPTVVFSPPSDPSQHHWHGWDLLLHGFPWEAHEAWETVWRATTGPTKSWIQGLIRLAAALCKAREKNWPAIDHHLAGAWRHWDTIPPGQVRFHQILQPDLQDWLTGPARDRSLRGWREQMEQLIPGNPGPVLLPDLPGACPDSLLTSLRVLYSQTVSETGL